VLLSKKLVWLKAELEEGVKEPKNCLVSRTRHTVEHISLALEAVLSSGADIENTDSRI
jgi:hypothetical protein